VRALEFFNRFEKNASCAFQRSQIDFTIELARVVDDDVVLAVHDFRLVDRQARVFTDLDLLIIAETTKVGMAVALGEQFAVLND
jgi:hypothetical protein